MTPAFELDSSIRPIGSTDVGRSGPGADGESLETLSGISVCFLPSAAQWGFVSFLTSGSCQH